ncbi:type III-A CRISPR-associated RAMP protein Csm4 [Methanothermobacter sp.]|uniref:type III-A CRISPR-associated RAMP protein Csm4 n=1 Tax=Methanothermobacter sp. TaxID=1884223 RepID=UPI002612E84C|nr:type III-A CRISPR-associated RAMP protein Csm4 [Methanothermobacter sp.]MDI9619153.1 type III-A CRISPR-associated RAMP protein Csm4 [Methanothermobacter sp.]
MLVYLKPESSLPELSSDTIFGSIIYSFSQLYPDELNDIMDLFTSDPPFLVSSSFPYIENDERVRFYPKIITEPEKRYDPQKFKKYKKTAHIQEDIFLSWTSGEIGEADIVGSIDDYRVYRGLLFDSELDLKFGEGEFEEPHNVVNRIERKTENIYHITRVFYENMGRFFLVKFRDESFRPYLKSAMKFLSDRGLGPDVSTGKGHFSFEIAENRREDNGGDRFLTLSRFIPTPDEVKALGADAWFELGSKRGRGPDGEIRRQVRFFREGSTFRDTGKEYYGTIVRSGKSAVEYGLAYKLSLGGG